MIDAMFGRKPEAVFAETRDLAGEVHEVNCSELTSHKTREEILATFLAMGRHAGTGPVGHEARFQKPRNPYQVDALVVEADFVDETGKAAPFARTPLLTLWGARERVGSILYFHGQSAMLVVFALEKPESDLSVLAAAQRGAEAQVEAFLVRHDLACREFRHGKFSAGLRLRHTAHDAWRPRPLSLCGPVGREQTNVTDLAWRWTDYTAADLASEGGKQW